MRALHKLQALVPLLISSSIITATPVAQTGSSLPSEPTGPNMPYDITIEIRPPLISNRPFVKVRMHEGTKRDEQKDAGFAVGSIDASSFSSNSDGDGGSNDEGPGNAIPPWSSSSSTSSSQTQARPPSIHINEARVVHNDAVKCVIAPADPVMALTWPNYMFSKETPLNRQVPSAGQVTCAFLNSVPPNHIRVELYPPVRERPTVDIPLAENGRGYVSLVDEDAGIDGTSNGGGEGADGDNNNNDNDDSNMARRPRGEAEFTFSHAWIISDHEDFACSLVNRDMMNTDEQGVPFNGAGLWADGMAEDITGVECRPVPSTAES